MSRIAYVNGRYLPQRAATVHVEDRGYQFSDGVYEVCEVRGGRLIDERRHLARLERSLDELRIAMPMSQAALAIVMREMRAAQPRARRHRLPADHARRGAPRSCLSAAGHAAERRGHRSQHRCRGQRAHRRRGHRRHHRARQPLGSASTSSRSRCCPMCWRSRRRASSGAKEAWFVDRDGLRHRGSSSNAWIVTRDGKVVTRPADHGILRGHHPHRAARRHQRPRGSSSRSGLHGRGGLCGARSLRDLGQPDRHAGRSHRRPPGRQRGARVRLRPRCGREFHRHAEWT